MSLKSNEESVLQLLWEGEGRVIGKEWWESEDQKPGLDVWFGCLAVTDRKPSFEPESHTATLFEKGLTVLLRLSATSEPLSLL